MKQTSERPSRRSEIPSGGVLSPLLGYLLPGGLICIFTQGLTICRYSYQESSLSERDLGVAVDDKSNWKVHTERQSQMTIGSYWMTSKTFGKTWRLNPKVTLWFYTVVIRPLILYASLVWWSATQRAFIRKKTETSWKAPLQWHYRNHERISDCGPSQFALLTHIGKGESEQGFIQDLS